MKFNEKLIQLRKSKGWSQEELGDKLDVTRQTLSKWELGQTTPEMDKLIEISKLFNISIDVLVGNEEIQVKNEADPFRYEYKSKEKLFGLPLVHINTGIGNYKAKGIIAIGPMAQGIIAIGALSMGLIAIGALSIGLLAFGALAIALVSIGVTAIGGVAIGGIAVAVFTLGWITIGVYSLSGEVLAQIEKWKILLFISIVFIIIPGLIVEIWFSIKKRRNR